MRRDRTRAYLAVAVAAAALAFGRPHEAAANWGPVRDPASGHFYGVRWGGTSLTWHQAKETAESLGGHLATITSAAEQNFVRYCMTSIGVSSAWLGASDEETEGEFRWVTAEPWSYTAWKPGRPDAASGNDDYLALVWSGAVEWYDVPDAGQSGGGINWYVVEWEPDPPTAPADVVATYVPGSGVELSWTNTTSIAVNIEVERRPAGYAYGRRALLARDATSFSDDLLDPSISYTYRVRATGAIGNSEWSQETSATTSADEVSVPPAVPDLQSLGLLEAPAGVQVRWADNSFDEIGFEVQRSEGGAPFEPLATVGPDVTETNDVAGRAGWPYLYRVRAVGLSGPSAWSKVEYVRVGGGWLGSLPTGILRDSRRRLRDTLRMRTQWASKGEYLDIDPVANGLELKVGPINAPVTVSIPPGDPRWTARGEGLRWRSRSAGSPWVEVVITTKNEHCSACLAVRISNFDFDEAPWDRVVLLGILGSDSGGVMALWNPRGRGVLRHR